MPPLMPPARRNAFVISNLMVLRRLTLRSETFPATKPAHSATSYCCLRGDVRAGPEM